MTIQIGAIDPGPHCGCAIVEFNGTATPRVVNAWSLDLEEVYSALCDDIYGYSLPRHWIVESVGILSRAKRSHRGLVGAGYNHGHVVASLNAALADTYDLTPNEWRTKLGLRNNVSKQGAWSWVERLVDGFDLAKNEHERDAICLALAGRDLIPISS